MATAILKPTIEHARKVLAVVDAGLCFGKGEPAPGMMCVEAAVCFAMGLPHGDNPPCVHPVVREFKIKLNDKNWSSKKARAKGLRRIAVAQLGSADTVDGKEFAKILAEETIRQIVPIALRAAASMKANKNHKDALNKAADECEKEGTVAAAQKAQAAAYAANAAYAAANAAEYAAANAAANAAYAAEYAANAAEYAAEYAANAAEYAAKTRDKILSLMAEIGVKALQKCGSFGCKWLKLCD